MDMGALVGQNTVRLRRLRKLTQEQLAEEAGFSQQYIINLELGRTNPTVKTLRALGDALGVTPADLVTPYRNRGKGGAKG